MTDEELLNIYIQLLPFLQQVLGSNTEIVIHDIRKPDCSLIAIENPISGRTVGAPLTDMFRQIIANKEYENKDFISNYNGSSKSANFVSSTFFIKNQKKLIGLLCINKDTTSVSELNLAIKSLLQGYNLSLPDDSTYSETFESHAMDEIIKERIQNTILNTRTLPKRMSADEKIMVIKTLQQEGVLTMKGAVTETANQLHISVPTLYRYIKRASHDSK